MRSNTTERRFIVGAGVQVDAILFDGNVVTRGTQPTEQPQVQETRASVFLNGGLSEEERQRQVEDSGIQMTSFTLGSPKIESCDL